MTGERLRVVVAPDSLKGSLSAAEAARAIAAGWTSVRADDEIVLRPMADGGEGTLEAFLAAHDAEVRTVRVIGADGREHDAPWTLLSDGTAVVELGVCCGIEQLGSARAPFTAHTGGFGQAIAAALDAGARRLVLGIGSSASTDGGAGMLRALGARLLDADGRDVGPSLSDGGRSRPGSGSGASVSDVSGSETSALEASVSETPVSETPVSDLPPSASGSGSASASASASASGSFSISGLGAVASVDLSGLRAAPDGGVLVLSDVTNPLLGPRGAAAVFGPQKGIPADRVAEVDDVLSRWSTALLAAAGRDDELLTAPGAGAAGGTGFALKIWGADLIPGAAAVAELIGLPSATAATDVVITGEGSYDAQSAAGKVPAHVASLSNAPAVLIAGRIAADADTSAFAAAFSLTELAGSSEASLADPRRWLHEAAAFAASRF
ncbi:glycerate kinase [Microbacterium sp. ZW T5_56]|uniref:glycerate kinase n=1 Tax=Microbacterium sp. ZW T5_56 TaxID=3378081 RepID=UPI003851DAEB